MRIFEAAKTRIKFLGLVEGNQLNGHLLNILQRSVGLCLTFSITLLPLIPILFTSESFKMKSEAGSALIVGTTNFSFYCIMIVNRRLIFDLFKMIEAKIEDRTYRISAIVSGKNCAFKKVKNVNVKTTKNVCILSLDNCR